MARLAPSNSGCCCRKGKKDESWSSSSGAPTYRLLQKDESWSSSGGTPTYRLLQKGENWSSSGGTPTYRLLQKGENWFSSGETALRWMMDPGGAPDPSHPRLLLPEGQGVETGHPVQS